MTEARKGDWIQTFTGGKIWPLDPRPDELRIEDIAHALACMNRFAGHTRVPYSVAEHSIRVSRWIRTHHGDAFNGRASVLAGLMHDASEAYLLDVVRPLKHLPGMAAYREAERVMQACINAWCDLPPEADRWPEVHQADEILLATEARDLLPAMEWGRKRAVPLPERIEPWTWQEAEAQFLATWRELRGAT